MCGKLRCQKSFKLKHISYEIGAILAFVKPDAAAHTVLFPPGFSTTEEGLMQLKYSSAARTVVCLSGER